ncbi:hypothetical protein AB838_16835 [Rhodobacteraceae bacterium (ex Bugula neritina AB1)]|nr:hypothetical protein AB838_16835 [Rhodobacteraceae bacterium (ex Bugula neritina AB1)]
MGLLRDSGHNIELVKYTSGTKTAKDLVSGKLDLATSSEFAFVSVTFDRPDLRILASLSRSRTIDVFARADRGIRGYADLAGKTVGVVQNSFAHFVLHRALLESGVKLGAMKPLLPPEIVSEITDGSIDAGVVWDPYLRKAATALGDQFIPLPHQEWHDYEFVLHGAGGWISANQQVANDIVGMLFQAAQLADSDPQTAKKIVGRQLDLDAGTMEYLWPKHTLKLTLSQALLRLMEDEAWFRIDLGLSEGTVPNYLDLIAADALKEADPAAISIIGLN